MAEMVLRCMRCGEVDDARRFEDAVEAQSAMAHWACPRCAWTEWELVEPEKEAEPIELGAGRS